MLARFHPLVTQWFEETFGEPSDPQRMGWPAIASGSHTLILAPTGTGKTLAAFLWELNELITRGLEEPLPNAVHLLYISPLKALNNDIQRNLDRPLADLRSRFAAAGQQFPEIRVAVRTGDTPASARERMLRKSPHILITTPESLNIMLTTLKGRGMFSGGRAISRRLRNRLVWNTGIPSSDDRRLRHDEGDGDRGRIPCRRSWKHRRQHLARGGTTRSSTHPG